MIKQESSMVTTGAQTNFSFDPSLVQIVSLERGKPYQRASLIYGEILTSGEQRTGPVAIADANSTGTLKNIATFFIPGAGSVQPGSADFVKVTLQAKAADGTAPITLSGISVLNEAGDEFGAQANNGQVVVQTGAAAPLGASSNPSSLPNSGGAPGEESAGLPIWLTFVAGLLLGGGAALTVSRRLART
jgi:hypothetical protein